jgi:glycosyltransferase involved in cell wall biosynthesis
LRILIFTDWFEPAYKAGGPVRSVVNMVRYLSHHDDVFVFTADRDLDDLEPFDEIAVDEWIKIDGIKVFYGSPGRMTFAQIRKVIREINPDWVYLNSMFSNMIIPLMVAYQSGKIIMAPRGMLKPSALSHKYFKKYFYCAFLRFMGIEKYIRFHALDLQEVGEISKVFPKAGEIMVAPNIASGISRRTETMGKNPGKLVALFSARLHPIKNLDFLLRIMKGVKGEVSLKIAIIREDESYFRECLSLSEKLPANVSVTWMIDLPPDDILKLLKTVHLFVLPTKGESFGHSIFEALSVGCPVLISDQTPWKGLFQRKAGMELPLQQELFVEAINSFVEMSGAEWQSFSEGAADLAIEYMDKSDPAIYYSKLFSRHESQP